MSEHEQSGETFRRIRLEHEDTRTVFEMYRDAILASPTGEPFFSTAEWTRIEALDAAEVVAEAEAITTAGSAVLAHAGMEVSHV